MPKDSLEISVQVWLLDGNMDENLRVYPVGFPVEPAMVEMFRCKGVNDFRSVENLQQRNVHFQWARNEDLGQFAQCWVGTDVMIPIGSPDFPADKRLNISVTAVPAFDLTLMTSGDRDSPFPWSKSERKRANRDKLKRKRRQASTRRRNEV